jgi:Ras-related protein Rab-11A
MDEYYEKNRENPIKIVLLGSSGVGKSNLLNTYFGFEFNANHQPNINGIFRENILRIDGKEYLINLWDTIGQEKFRTLNKIYMKGGVIFIMVYDITNRSSFEELNSFKEDINNLIGNQCVIGIVGNKRDLLNNNKPEVSEEEALDFAKKNGFFYKLLSAKYPDEFDSFVKELVKRYLELVSQSASEKEQEKKLYSLDEEVVYVTEGTLCYKYKVKRIRQKYYPSMERFKGRVFPWYMPKWEYRFKKEKDTLL